MNRAFPGRAFQVWLFRVSHGELLVRSPKDGEHQRNVDLTFAGVEYMELPRHLVGLRLEDPTEEDVRRAEERVGTVVAAETVTVLVSQGRRYLVVAGFVKVAESDMDIFDHPFE